MDMVRSKDGETGKIGTVFLHTGHVCTADYLSAAQPSGWNFPLCIYVFFSPSEILHRCLQFDQFKECIEIDRP